MEGTFQLQKQGSLGLAPAQTEPPHLPTLPCPLQGTPGTVGVPIKCMMLTREKSG